MTVGRHRGGSGEPLVLIHGFTATWKVWEPLLPALEKRHDVLALTLPGHFEGQSIEKPSIATLADALERDLDREGFETAHLVGNSLGGWMALELAKRGRARSVVALSPAGGWEANSRSQKRVEMFFRRTRIALKFAGPRARFLTSRPGLRKLALRDAMAHPERMSPRAAADMIHGGSKCEIVIPLMEAVGRDGPPTDFSGVDVPVRVAWGTADRILTYPRYWEPLKSILPPHTELVEMPGLGHVPMWDDPELVARTVLEVTARSPVSAAAG
jgi:pimeloyl-ACP methyl ester carboxylesterase